MPDGKNKRYKKPKVGKNVSGSKSYKKQASEKKSTKKNPGETGGFRFGRTKIKYKTEDERSRMKKNISSTEKAKNEDQAIRSVNKITTPDEVTRTVTKGKSTLRTGGGGRNLPKQKKLKYRKSKA